MNKFGLRPLAAISVAMLAFVGVGATAAGARTTALGFVGTYKVHVIVAGQPAGGGTMVVNADGTALLGRKAIAQWTAIGSKITIVYKLNQHHVRGVEKFVGRASGRGIGTKLAPGTFTVTVQGTSFSGSWYAVKTA